MILGEPRTVSEILENFNFEDFRRTVRQMGTNYYKSIKDTRYSIKADIGTNIVFRFEDLNTRRQESVTYNFKWKKVYKFFKENTPYKPELRNMTFDFVETEEESFQRSLMESNKFFPDFGDYSTAKAIYDLIVLDSFKWEADVDQRAQARMAEAAKAYRAKFNNSPWWQKR